MGKHNSCKFSSPNKKMNLKITFQKSFSNLANFQILHSPQLLIKLLYKSSLNVLFVLDNHEQKIYPNYCLEKVLTMV